MSLLDKALALAQVRALALGHLSKAPASLSMALVLPSMAVAPVEA